MRSPDDLSSLAIPPELYVLREDTVLDGGEARWDVEDVTEYTLFYRLWKQLAYSDNWVMLMQTTDAVQIRAWERFREELYQARRAVT